MLLILYLVCLCSNFLFIKSEDNGTITIDQKRDINCTINRSKYTFMDGQKVSLIVTSKKLISNGWWQLISTTGSRNLYYDLNTKGQINDPILYTSLVDKSMEGTWQFKFHYLYDGNSQQNDLLKVIHYENGDKYYESVCQTDVKIVPNPTVLPYSTSKTSDEMFLIIASVVGAVLLTVIIAQAAYIILLKNKAQKLITLNTHNNLSKKTEPVPNDTARYCSNPGQKMMKVADPVDDDNRDSVIYEAPNIELSGNARMPIMQPPQPPAITTMPRTPRPDHNMKIGPQATLGNFQRPKLEREINVANRPPLPLPTQDHMHPGFPHPGLPHPGVPHPGLPHNNMYQEDYEEMETEDNTYESPPIINTMPPRLPMPPKKVPTGHLLDVKENTLKMRQGNKPQVIPKPQQLRPNMMAANEFEQALRRRNNDTMPKPNPGHMSPMQQELAMRRRPNGDAKTNELEEALRKRNNVDTQTNELEEALRRRNNVKQVPIVSIPDPSSRGSPKPRPPPALKSKPRGPPVNQPVQEEVYYNENQASSDEEWTYEPLKPLNSYDTNIYNV